MMILAFESSARSASVALLDEGKLLGEYFQHSGQTHSRTLLKMAEDLLKNCDKTVADVHAVAVANGPGSFTGLRIGVAAAKGLAWGREIPCVGVSTLEAMVYGASLEDGEIVCCMDARRDQVYNAVFSVKDGVITRITEDRAISLEDLGNELKNSKKTKILIGDGALLCYNHLYENQSLRLAPEHQRMQRASGVALLAYAELCRGDIPDAAAVSPNYLRMSQAEREREAKKQKNCEG